MATRDTTTGLAFENKIYINRNGINLTKTKLAKYFKDNNKNLLDVVSRELRPDEAYLDGDILWVYEKKYQQTEGSADEKPQTCGFKIWEYRKIAKALGAKDAKYIYILSDWFKQDKYRDMLEYIKLTDGCDYFFEDEKII